MARLLSLLILSGVVLGNPCLAGTGPDKDKTPPAPSVVHTWGELLDQPAITLPDGKKVHLGLEAKTLPCKTAFLVYALVDGNAEMPGGTDVLGPLVVEMRSLRDERPRQEKERTKTLLKTLANHLLFAKTLFVDRPGDYEVVFRLPDGSVVAKTTITATEKESHPWLALGRPDEAARIEAAPLKALEPGQSYWRNLKLVLKGHKTAFPLCQGYMPVLTDPPQVPREQALPRWSFDRPDARLQLKSADSASLRLEFKTYMACSTENLLLRLWVNGQPYVPSVPAKKKLLAQLEALRQPTQLLTKKFQIGWQFDPALVNARTGDRIGVQVLYCPQGWQKTEARHEQDRSYLDNTLPLLSNKLEFLVASEPDVVRRLDELAGRAAITLADGTKIRLGLETRKLPQKSAFLVYALVDDSRWTPRSDEYLGPVKVEIAHTEPQDRFKAAKAKVERMAAYALRSKQVLFAKTLLVDRPGDYRITFRDKNETVIASTLVTATEEETQPWLAFGTPENAQEEQPTKQDRRVPWLLKGHRAAVALCDGSRPLFSDETAIPPEQPLPRWVFEKPDPGLQLKGNQQALHLESKMDLALIEENFLFRLWVNGQPYLPQKKADDALAGEPKAIDAIEKERKKLTIAWQFDPQQVQAKKGDRIAVQLLYCPSGREIIRSELYEKLHKLMLRETTPRLPLLTNKVEWVVP